MTRTCGNSVAISTIPITITDTTTTVAKPAVATATTRTPELVVACAPNTAQVNLNDTAVWISNITGGNGKYTYDWQGSDGLAGDTNFLTKTYVTNGQKTAVLTVKSGTQTVTRICGNVAVGENSNNLSASAFFAGWTGPFIILLLIAIIVFLGIILYFINLRDRNHPVVTTATQNYDNNNLL